MKASSIITATLLASATTSRNQVEAGLPPVNFAGPVSRGLCTGAISSGVRNIVNGWQEAFNQGHPTNSTQTQSPGIVRKAICNFPVSFTSNAVATAYVDRLFSISKKATVKNVAQLALPIASMELARGALDKSSMPKPVKESLAAGAFFAGAVAQGKAPVATALSISGFMAGASVVKSISNRQVDKPQTDLQETTETSKVVSGLAASATSGFMAPASSKVSDKSTVKSYDDYIRRRYGMKEGEKFWMGPDGSIFVPIDPSEVGRF